MSHLSKYLQEYLQSDGYPIIKIPQRITEILSEVCPPPPALKKPAEPKKPVLTILPQPTSPKRSVLSWVGLDAEYDALMRVYKRDLIDIPKFNKQFQEHHELALKWYKKELDDYNSNILPDYNNEYSLYQDLLRWSKSPIEDKDSRLTFLLIHLHCNSPMTTEYQKNKKLSKGITEPFFEKFLNEHYKENFALAQATIISEGNENFYEPDFVLTDYQLKICIEIDEPYVAATNEPIHFLEDLNERKRNRSRGFVPKDMHHIDSKRDAFFINHQWIVVRFTEKQVVENPKACLFLLDKIINYTKMQESNIIVSPNNAVRIEKKWTRYDAEDLAKNKYRQSYLPRELSQAVTNMYNANNPKVERSTPIDYDDDYDLPF